MQLPFTNSFTNVWVDIPNISNTVMVTVLPYSMSNSPPAATTTFATTFFTRNRANPTGGPDPLMYQCFIGILHNPNVGGGAPLGLSGSNLIFTV
jgi:hypothetical protein